ncbi:aldehyde dehydrogenase family protein [Sphingobium sp. 3R8]|uniref:aldehyde dehydrogenase family protein n=1 Tax=Sphingobium sp. 3R8 TaxID=2874921 RepID=UPI001CC8F5D5|nr:aldehyde dehydrogenase family protein [Sphingobium sp. 3R8]MBZ9650219.1 aldehyde dehydrogenase family protein [Sphingobium sp. 3R8]
MSEHVYTQTINGVAAPITGTFDVINPATGAVFAQAPECTPEQVEEVMTAAHEAFKTWRSAKDARRVALHAAADIIEANTERLVEILVKEQGKPKADAGIEIFAATMVFRYYADLEIAPDVIQDDEIAYSAVIRQPIGPAVAITAWNIPIILATCKIAPLLAAGNTVILKPSPYTPLTTLLLGELLRGVFPPGVLNVVSGGMSFGPELTQHPLTRKITMTGSTATGKKVAAAAAAGVKRVTLELGGNDAAIVLADADPKVIAQRIFWGSFRNSGQLCIAAKRIYVHESIVAEVTAELAAIANTVTLGDGMDDDTQLGPLQNLAQFEKVSEIVQDALAKGAKAVTGGYKLDREGYFYAPTILADARHGMRVVDEEQFGPVMPIISFSDVEEVLKLANDTEFGLGGSVWTSDSARGAALARRLEAGMVWVNTHSDNVFPTQPFGGVKQSGIGLEMGPWGYIASTDAQTIYESRQTDTMSKQIHVA